ncbi:MAG: tRNA uridine-5-carboxymethylaminomethyl(34) synthesis GTPase MnmE [Erysipelotrichaceae bacterium]|nr:tRNA uridine-5-carboxymethylaminomethyl(34) synthesis GTPase MnmE [Erysipelotrichaceae bacterium]
MLNDTIAAISTALKEGAISIVRLSGEDSFAVLKEISDIKDIEANTIRYAHIYDGEEVIDEVLVSCFRAPRSYTREDMVEINCHGGVYVTRRILNLLLSKGCRLAEAGEFTKRAYLNGRIDLSKAESANDLIRATTRIQARSAIKGLSGSIEKLLDPLMDEMKDVISMIEVNIDYPEYDDVTEMTNNNVKPYIRKWIEDMKVMIDKAERFRLIKDGITTVIVGKPNVGKSSLPNAMIEQDKAIVTDVAGTTRDLVEGRLELKNVTLKLVDTAGIRESEDKVEKIGIERSRRAIEDAELVILVIDASDETEEDRELLELTKDKKRIVVYNKSDIQKKGEIAVSALHNDISALIDRIEEMYKDDVSLIDEDVLNNERQIALMRQALEELEEMEAHIDETSLDVVMLNIEESYHHLCAILGKEYQEDLIDHMFRNFCLGK